MDEEARPTNVLLVGFLGSYGVIDDEALKHVMPVFGVVTKIKVFANKAICLC